MSCFVPGQIPHPRQWLAGWGMAVCTLLSLSVEVAASPTVESISLKRPSIIASNTLDADKGDKPLLAPPFDLGLKRADLPAANYRNVAYASTSAAQVLDLYLPKGNGPFPVVVNIHGGAFIGGDKAMLDAPVLARLLAAGYAVASINYRLSGEAPFPAAIQDAKAAVRFLRASAEQFHLDADRFAAFGQSAGGNIAAMLGTTGVSTITRNGAVAWVDPKLGNTTSSSQVQAVVDWFGPTDFAQMDADLSNQGCATRDLTHNLPGSPESRFLGATVGAAIAIDLVQDANPISYISEQTPPFLIQHGSVDCTVPTGQSQRLASALKAKGIEATLAVQNGAGHGMPAASWMSQANLDRMLTFLDRTLKRSLPKPAE